MTKIEKILHKIRLICYFFFPILLVVFANIHHTGFNYRQLLGYNIVPQYAGTLYGRYLSALSTVLSQWGMRDFYIAFFVYWALPLSAWYFITLPLLYLIDFFERDLLCVNNKILTEVFSLLPYVLLFMNVAQENFTLSSLADPATTLVHFGQYQLTDLTFGGLLLYLPDKVLALSSNLYGYVLTLHPVGVELMLIPIYAVLYLIKLIKGGFIKNVA